MARFRRRSSPRETAPVKAVFDTNILVYVVGQKDKRTAHGGTLQVEAPAGSEERRG